MAAHFCFVDFLNEDQKHSFFTLPHREQIALVEAYVEHLRVVMPIDSVSEGKKTTATFSTENCAFIVPIVSALSGFGVHGTDSRYLPQKEWAFKVARLCEHISHQYVVEGNPCVLNSRSFFNYWCHAEKQIMVYVREKWTEAGHSPADLWAHVVVHVTRAPCPDCCQFARDLAAFDGASIRIASPDGMQVFAPFEHI